MTEFIRIFGRRAGPTSAEIVDFLEHGASFGSPTISVEPSGASQPSGWRSITLEYDPARRPLIIWNSDDALASEEVNEALAELVKLNAPSRTDIGQNLRDSVAVYAIETKFETLTDDAWELLDSIEAYLARICDGIVRVPEDGFFDKSLHRLA